MMCTAPGYGLWAKEKGKKIKLPEFEITVNPPLPHDLSSGGDDEHVQFCAGITCLYLGQITESFPWFLKSAEQGNPDAMMMLAAGYEYVKKDAAKAEKWYRDALEHAHPDAQKNLDELLAGRTQAPVFSMTRDYDFEYKPTSSLSSGLSSGGARMRKGNFITTERFFGQ
jgi:TPR repeat protein